MIIRRNPEIAFQKICGQYFLVDTKKSYLYELNESASFFWEIIGKKGLDIEKIITRILDEYEVEEKILRGDLIEFIQKLSRYDLIQIV